MLESVWSMPLFGTDIYHIASWFWVYSILGWLAESIYMSICNKKITNRGFIRGPICPIYGFGALTVYFTLRPLEGNYIALYIAGMVLATAVEFLAAKLMIRYMGGVWWDYTDKPFNYKGILCLESCLGWGLYTVLMFGILQKLIVGFVDSYSYNTGKCIVVLVLVYYVVSFIMSVRRNRKYEGEKRDGIQMFRE